MSEPITLGDRRTPQGSVLSPLLFNLALLPLPKLLGKIEHLGHALYADDITIWLETTGSQGWMEATLQRAADTVNEYAQKCGLSCAPQKSELVIIGPRNPERACKVEVEIDGARITPSTHTKILGLIIQADGKASQTVKKLKTTTDQILNMIRRVSNRRRGMKEDDTLRLVQSFVISRTAWTKKGRNAEGAEGRITAQKILQPPLPCFLRSKTQSGRGLLQAFQHQKYQQRLGPGSRLCPVIVAYTCLAN